MSPSRSQTDALSAGLRILASRPHAAAELRRKLRRRGYEREEVEGVVGRLAQAGYLDDAEFARSLVGWRSAGRGRRAIASELAARGVSREDAEAALGDLDRDQEVAAAAALVARILPAGAGEREVARAAGRLRRRGFAEGAIRSALRDRLESAEA